MGPCGMDAWDRAACTEEETTLCMDRAMMGTKKHGWLCLQHLIISPRWLTAWGERSHAACGDEGLQTER